MAEKTTTMKLYWKILRKTSTMTSAKKMEMESIFVYDFVIIVVVRKFISFAWTYDKVAKC